MTTRMRLRRRTFPSANVLWAQAGTNAPMGGDASHGGRTVLTLRDLTSTSWEVEVDGEVIRNPDSVTIRMLGDTECETFCQALAWAASVYQRLYPENKAANEQAQREADARTLAEARARRWTPQAAEREYAHVTPSVTLTEAFGGGTVPAGVTVRGREDGRLDVTPTEGEPFVCDFAGMADFLNRIGAPCFRG
jgi:hypothetical protein